MSRVGGVGIDVIAEEVAAAPRSRVRQQAGRAAPSSRRGGEYQWRRDGEYHLFNPETVFKLQHATRSGQYTIFKEYTQLVDTQNQNRATLRGLFRLKPVGPPVPIDEVEPAERHLQAVLDRRDVVRLDQPGGARDAGDRDEPPWRTGRTPARGARIPNATSRSPTATRKRSAIKQVASGRFGVTSEYLVNADDLQIKMAQGAKPGEGGQLPGHKVYPWIAKVRYSTPGVGSDLAAAASRHLLDRGPGAAHLRPEELEPARAHPREAGRRGRRRHGGGGRGEGPLRRRADLRPRRRHRRVAADQPQARRPAVGARPRGNAAGAGPQQAARPHRRAGGRPDEDRAATWSSARCSGPRSSASPRRRWS